MSELLPKPDLRNPLHWVAFGLGSGLAPKAPGTFGTLAGFLLYWPMAGLPLMPYLALSALLFIVGIPICGRTSRDLGVHDHGGIVWDEMVGLLVTLIAVPAGWPWLLAAFLLFRLFDIWKPWPIGWLDRRVAGGLGIMLDDLLAGILALVVLQLIALGVHG